ncbi:meiotic cell cortex C-terminal pleckstrin homology-domain-containing protein [Spinellus fusiger]|nr:meiotic cell cortex C-terminal pleckstrin homology-domain-containing protein [Spinellus fusiger]
MFLLVDILSSDLQSSIRDVNNYGEMQRVTKVTYDISDPVLAAALTQTMIGNWMWKHTRKVAGLGISEKKHQRFFWVHPYTKTLYWNTQESGVETMDHNTKSELIDSFEILYEESSKNPSLPPSFLIKSPTRSIKIQCLDISTFDSWNNSLSYLTMDMFNIAHLNADLVEKKTTSSTFPLQSVNIGQDEESEVEESVGMPKSRPSTLSFSDPSDTILRTSQDKGKQPANTDANEMPRPNIDATQDCRSPLPVPLSTKSLRRRMSLHFMDFSFNRPNKTDPDSINYKSEKLEINTRE